MIFEKGDELVALRRHHRLDELLRLGEHWDMLQVQKQVFFTNRPLAPARTRYCR
eukprot:m.3103 g.3103  ORF g.3103 m.3103 type:complete len:54 (-) comp2263_c0_seq1:1030-1191(-)